MTRSAGVIYLTINGLAALLRTLCILAWTRLRFASSAHADSDRTTPAGHKAGTLEKVLGAFRKRFLRIVTITAPIYFLMYALNQAGVFEQLRDAFSHWAA